MKSVVGGTSTIGLIYTCFDFGTSGGVPAFSGCYTSPPSIPCGICKPGRVICYDPVPIPNYTCA